ncbi:hypothetical protein ACX80E_06140 [Arthrobacter sp. TMN-49]
MNLSMKYRASYPALKTLLLPVPKNPGQTIRGAAPSVRQLANPLIGDVVELLKSAESKIERHARLSRHLTGVRSTDDANTIEALDWVLTSLQDVMATLEEISRRPMPQDASMEECLRGLLQHLSQNPDSSSMVTNQAQRAPQERITA